MSDFFAMLSRMKYIDRWGLMNNTRRENLSEHSLEVAIIAHALAVIGNKRFNKSINAERTALLAIFHDCSEIITGDLPTPVKYYNKQIQEAYKDVERVAQKKLTDMLPEDLKEVYAPLICETDDDCEQALMHKYVKAADRISALIKCNDELRMGNAEFKNAKDSIEKSILALNMEEVSVFIDEMLPAYSKTLDELSL